MIEPVFQPDNYQLARKLLDAAVLRHEAIASNIANAETPGYRRVDVSGDFATALRARFTQAAGAGPDAGRASLADLEPRLVEDASVRTIRPDGNSVELEGELLAMSRNNVEYNFLADVVGRHIKHLKLAISGRTT
ncbi:flagellar basal-body rod protein FlgB [Opitutaceae bacterium TAV5]|nr:flagellar basal-body rod protein FlgB [Opitutaceae bacterium TAV5]